MNGLPIDDWQFWVATGLAASGLLLVVWPLLPRRGRAKACPGCPSGTAASRPKRTDLTIEGKRL